MNMVHNGKKKKTGSGGERDYKKRSKIKSIIFLILAAIILGGMYLKEQPGQGSNREEEAVQAELKTRESAADTGQDTSLKTEEAQLTVTEDGTYTDKDHVSLYLHIYGKLPSNYITKTKAKKAGWDPEKGNLQEVLPGMSIGGGGFQNEEGLLPDKAGRSWYECDIGYEGGERNSKRIVWSSDGLIYYTEDHYKSFEQLYGN